MSSGRQTALSAAMRTDYERADQPPGHHQRYQRPHAAGRHHHVEAEIELDDGDQGGEGGHAPGDVGDRRAVHAQARLEDRDHRGVGQPEHQRHAGDQDRHPHLRG